jgi:hypothetical protein
MDPLDQALHLSITGEFDSAEKLLKSLDQNNPRVRFNLGWYQLKHGEFLKGYEGLEVGRRINVFGTNKPRSGYLYTGQDITNKTVLFAGEGGIGDEIVNIRFVDNFVKKGAKVIVSCQPCLFSIFNKIPNINAICDSAIDEGVYYDYFIPAMSAPYYLNLTYEDINGIPYLQYFTPRKLFPFNNNLKVGIKWSGNPEFEHHQHRKFPVKLMLDLLDIPDITFYSLQRDGDYVDEDRFVDLRYELKSWKDTAEIVAGLDLIITSCTSIAHLSAAMGKPTWVVVPVLPYYIWSRPGNSTPWYKTVTIYRQTKFKNWVDPFVQIKKDLIDYKEYHAR